METVIDPVEQFTLSVSSGQGGSVNNVDGTYNRGTQVTITATPEEGYEFTGWSDSSYGDTNPLILTVGANTSITAQFSKIKYLLGVDVIGEGSVSQEVISTGKTPTEYNSGAVVRLESIPSDGWLFHTWSGASTDTGNIIDITIDGTKTVTASFEEIIAIVLDPNGISARGVGKWKIKKRTSLSEASKDVSSQEKILNDPCEIYEVIFRSDGTFTMISAVGTNSGNYVYTDESTIYLTEQGQEYARYENVVLTESVMSFTLILGDCDYSYKTEKDETYDEATDPLTGTVTDTIECTITGGLSRGSISQTVTASYEITPIAFEFSTTCTESFIVTASGLPPGISIVNNNSCCADVQGTVSQEASGTYLYSVTVSNSITSLTVTGSIEVVQESIASCTSATLYLIDGQLNQTITLGDAITQTRLQLDTDCPDDDNNVPLNSISSGLPSGVGYSFDGENNQVIISGTPEFAGVFEYSITYFNNDTIDSSTVTTSIGGTFTVSSTQATTTTDNTPPVITLNGSSTIQLTVGDSWTDPGATATDETDGDITSSITVNGTVDTSTVGTYTLTYSVADAASNSASTTRVVIVNPGATSSIYFENGTCKCPNASVGDTATIDGIVYTVVDNSTIQGEVDNGNVNLCTTKVTNMYRLFLQKTTFNSDIGFWDTSNVTNMEALFQGAWVFNQDISNWDTSSVTNMHLMFYVARAFNQNIGAWNVSNVTDMSNMFNDANAFNQDLGGWDTSNVTTMASMFTNTPFNQDIGNWNVSNVEDMTGVFTYASSFNQDVGGWDLSSATTINGMFMGASSFNQDIGGWNTSSVTGDGFINVFVEATSFNQDIGDWDVSNGTNFQNMFLGATSFNQDLSGWCVSNVQTESPDFATDSALTESNKPVWGTCPDFNINVTASSSSDYTLSGSDRNGTVSGNDPNITINLGDEINFIVNAANHPFYIKTAQGTGTDNLASNVNNNGATSGVVNWTPTAAGTYYYQCSLHNGMYGVITVQ